MGEEFVTVADLFLMDIAVLDVISVVSLEVSLLLRNSFTQAWGSDAASARLGALA